MALQYAFPLFSVISGFLWKLFTLSLKELGSTQGYIICYMFVNGLVWGYSTGAVFVQTAQLAQLARFAQPAKLV